MKDFKQKLFFLVAIFLMVYKSNGQSNNTPLGVYSWKSIVPMQACNIQGTTLPQPLTLLSRIGQKFNFIQRINDTDALIQILNYRDSSEEYLLFNKGLSRQQLTSLQENRSTIQRQLAEAQLYFLVPISSISEAAKPVFARNWQFAVGALTMPVKMRVQKEFDFSGSFNISAAGGAKWRMSRYNENYLDILVSIGLSSVNVDSAVRSNADIKVLPAANLSALTISTGFVFEFGKAQVGLMLGWDYLSARDQKNYQWKYNGKPWIAIGFGLAIFGKQEEKASASSASNGGVSE